MKIDELIYHMKCNGYSNDDIRATIYLLLDEQGHVINRATDLVIDTKLRQFQAVA